MSLIQKKDNGVQKLGSPAKALGERKVVAFRIGHTITKIYEEVELMAELPSSLTEGPMLQTE